MVGLEIEHPNLFGHDDGQVYHALNDDEFFAGSIG